MATSKKTKPVKTTTTHPVTRRERKMDAAIYDAVKAAINKSLKGSKGKTFTALTNDVKATIRKTMPGFKGSVPWYTISVRLDMETRGLVETFTEKGKKMNRLAPVP
ncbi:MAG TPA: hypothetical protein VLJ68_14015 [Chitinophagaceae bacterium]|nr:hypothetical protein [Chitinophagaceae bacterium]